jgi:hypothetical protein
LRPPDFESGASASSAIPALLKSYHKTKGRGLPVSLQSRFKKNETARPVIVGWPRWMTKEKAAEYCSHSVDLIDKAIADGELRVVPKGKDTQRQHVVLDMLDIYQWLERKKQIRMNNASNQTPLA